MPYLPGDRIKLSVFMVVRTGRVSRTNLSRQVQHLSCANNVPPAAFWWKPSKLSDRFRKHGKTKLGTGKPCHWKWCGGTSEPIVKISVRQVYWRRLMTGLNDRNGSSESRHFELWTDHLLDYRGYVYYCSISRFFGYHKKIRIKTWTPVCQLQFSIAPFSEVNIFLIKNAVRLYRVLFENRIGSQMSQKDR